MALLDEVKEFLESVSKSISKETADILSTVIGKEVVISMNKISELDMDELTSLYPSDILSVRFNVSDKPEDLIYVLFEKDIAVKISSLTVMESDEGVEFSDEHLNSIKETANQILGNLSTVLSEELKRKVEFFSIEAEVLKLEPNLFKLLKPVSVEYSLNMGDNKERKVIEVLSSETVERFLKEKEETEETEETEGTKETEETEGTKETEETEETKETEETESREEVASEEAESAEIPVDTLEEIAETESEDIFPQVEQEEVEKEEEILTIEPQLPEVVAERIGVLMDLSLPITIELGRTRMLIKDILELGHGSVIEFDKLAGEPVDLLINDKKVAEGEIVVIDEHFGIRLTNLVKPSERIKNLGK